jgi:putative ABC transport system permease protein
MPVTTLRKLYPNQKDYVLFAKARYPDQVGEAVEEIRDLLRRKRRLSNNKPDDFALFTSDYFLDLWNKISGLIFILMFAVASVGLIVGGIGVMNIMLVSVTERTREIGIRKAIGAKSGDITWQFLLEAMTLTGAGGVIALILVNGLVILVRLSLKWPGSVPIWAAATGILVSISIGLVFGVWPAMKAAKLDPVEALRYE